MNVRRRLALRLGPVGIRSPDSYVTRRKQLVTMSPTSPSTGSGTVGSSATPSHDTGLSSASEAQQTELLSALTTGLRSANALPLGDDFEFLVSLPEVADALQGAQSELLDLLNEILEQVQRVQKSTNEYETLEDEDNNEYNDLEDPLLWEDCSEACEFLLEHAESYLQNETTKGTVTATSSTLQSLASHARTQLSRMVDGTIDMVKPQLAWSEWTPPNGRTQVFVPPMHPEKPHAVVPLDLSLRPGHGLETRFGEMRTVTVAPSIVGRFTKDWNDNLDFVRFSLFGFPFSCSSIASRSSRL